MHAPRLPPEPSPPLRKEGGPAKIVVIIDDMGMVKRRSRRAIQLPGPVTFAFLPYASGLEEMTAQATDRGHELLIHLPMEPLDAHLNPGPIALRSGMSAKDFNGVLDKAFSSFAGYAGINNHMGSKLTQDEEAMRGLMAALKARGLVFIDSKTIGSSVAASMAAEAGIKHAERDVFLDHQDTPEFVRSALRQTERIAARKGVAIAIGHPKDSTLKALAEWIPGLKERGFELVPVTQVVRQTKIGAKAAEAGPPALAAKASAPSSGSYFGPVQSPDPPPSERPGPY